MISEMVHDALTDEEIIMLIKRLILALNEKARQDPAFAERWFLDLPPYLDAIWDIGILRQHLLHVLWGNVKL